MSQLVYDDREEHDNKPGLHALLVGVSRYPALPEPGVDPTAHQEKYGLGLSQLTSAACSAYLVYKWLKEFREYLAVPLVTCRLLVAPSKKESEADPNIENLASEVDLKSFLKACASWRDDAACHRDNATLFYFAGHGLQRKRGDHVMILEDFGDGIGTRLHNAVDTFTLLQGMAPSKEYPDIARSQLYFIDACRMLTVDAYKYEDTRCTAVFDTTKLEKDDRAVPVFYTSIPGTQAFAIPGEQTLFSKALLRCLRGLGSEEVEGRWAVTMDSLNKGLQYHLARVSEEYEAEQEFRVDGFGKKMVLHYLNDPPNVDVEFEVVPQKSASTAKVVVNDFQNPKQDFGPPLKPHPYRTSLLAGNYLVEVSFGSRVVSNKLRKLDPPNGRWKFP